MSGQEVASGRYRYIGLCTVRTAGRDRLKFGVGGVCVRCEQVDAESAMASGRYSPDRWICTRQYFFFTLWFPVEFDMMSFRSVTGFLFARCFGPAGCLVLLFAGSLSVGFEASAQEIRHSFFVAGPNFTGIIDEDGKRTWGARRAGARDGWVLDNGNVLVAWANVVQELTRQHEVVFEYRLDQSNREIGTAQRLPGGNTLVTELGGNPRLLEITAEGKIAVEVPLRPETDNAHMQTRMARKLSSGNYLVPHLLAFKVKEYTPTGEVVREIATDGKELGGREAENWPFTAIRLDNGNTVVCLTHGNKVVEFGPDGKVVWKVSQSDLPSKPFDDACGGQRLPNGNTVITAYHAKEGVKLFEVTPDKKIVWTYEGPSRAHHFQILTTNGTPIVGRPLK